MKQAGKRVRVSRVFFGLVIMLVGAILLADRLQMAEAGAWWRLWPVLVIGLGVEKIVETWNTPERGSGGWLVFAGVWFLAVNYHWFGLTFHNSWPLLIIGVGLSIIWKSLFHARQPDGQEGPGGAGSSDSGGTSSLQEGDRGPGGADPAEAGSGAGGAEHAHKN